MHNSELIYRITEDCMKKLLHVQRLFIPYFYFVNQKKKKNRIEEKFEREKTKFIYNNRKIILYK